MKSIPVLIADKFDISRLGIESIINKSDSANVLKSVRNADELIKAYPSHPNSICIISTNVPDTNVHSLMEKLTSINPDAAVIVLSNSVGIAHLNQAIKAGVRGYFTKQVSAKELKSAVRTVYNGEKAFSPSVSKLIVSKYVDLAKSTDLKSPVKITKREREVLGLIVDGYTSSEIADMLYISPRTVETHRSNLMQKLDIKNTAGLVRFALEESNLL